MQHGHFQKKKSFEPFEPTEVSRVHVMVKCCLCIFILFNLIRNMTIFRKKLHINHVKVKAKFVIPISINKGDMLRT